jgi:hypothetical protein
LGWARGIGVGVGVGVGLDEVGLGLEILNLTLTLTLTLILTLRLAGAGGARRWRRWSGGQAAADAVDLMESMTFAVQGVLYRTLYSIPASASRGRLSRHARHRLSRATRFYGREALAILSLALQDYTHSSVEASSASETHTWTHSGQAGRQTRQTPALHLSCTSLSASSLPLYIVDV